MTCDFDRDFAYSLGERQRVDEELLIQAIPNCVSVRKTDTALDKKGIDYIATLDGGTELYIDAKTRRKGALLMGEPLLALEVWSVCPDENHAGKAGWTCSRTTDVDMILYTGEDWDRFYLVPFQQLRMAFQNNYWDWKEIYKPRFQNNRSWQSMAMFVPASIVLNAIMEQMSGEIYG